MADTPDADGRDEAKTQTAAYSRFYVTDPAHHLDIQTKAHIDAPDIRGDFNRAAAGAEMVSELEMSTLSGRPTHVYRSDPFDQTKVDAGSEIRELLSLIDKKIQGDAVQKGQWGPEEAAEQERLVGKLATATRLDADQVRGLAEGYEKAAIAAHHARADEFGIMDPKTPQAERSAIGETLVRQALGQEVTPEQGRQLQENIAKFAAENRFTKNAIDNYVDQFRKMSADRAADFQNDAVESLNETAQQRRNGFGEAYLSGDAKVNHTAVPEIRGSGDKAAFAAWMVNPADTPGHLPPGPPELGTFLISLHEAEHLSRQGDTIARAKDRKGENGLSSEAQEQANEIDADRAVMKYLDEVHEPAAKAYWLQAREVNSFTQGVISGDVSHDTATFLRVLDKTGQQLDLDAFNREKAALFERIKEKGAFTDIGRGQAKTGDVMGAVQDVLGEDKDQKDPSKKLSATQRAEAESFLKDAKAMGYAANPDYPKPAAQATGPAITVSPVRAAPTAPKA